MKSVMSFAAFAAIVAVAGCTSLPLRQPQDDLVERIQPTSTFTEPLRRELRQDFRKSYENAVVRHGEAMRRTSPVIIQSLLTMSLLRQDGSRVEFAMVSTPYMLMAYTAHPALAIYSKLSPSFGVVAPDVVEELTVYRKHLGAAVSEIASMDLPQSSKSRLTTMMTLADDFVAEVVAKRNVSHEEFEAFARSLRPHIQRNFEIGAREQIEQFLQQMRKWRTEYPSENWGDVHVVVLGTHQPREKYALLQFFQWLTREPDFERRVVYAEMLKHPSKEERAEVDTLALKLLSAVDFDRSASKLIFGDETTLGIDVMGPAATQILDELGPPTWP